MPHRGTLVEDILVLLGVSIAIVVLCQRIRLPSLIGFVLTGLLIGPYGYNLIRNVEKIEILAELGVVLLLFSLGIEFSIERLRELRAFVLKAGSLQVVLTLLVTIAGALLLRYNWVQAMLIGMILSLSSTAVGLKSLQQRKEVDSPHGRLTLGVLLFQDVLVPLFVLLVPLLGTLGELNPAQVALRLVWIFLGLAMVILIARFLVPIALRWIVTAETREVPVLGSLFIALLMSVLTERLGLSPALGAFIAGIIISETPYSHQITANIAPFRDSFLSLFFVAVGLLINVPFVLQHVGEAIGWTFLILAIKFGVVIAVARLLGYPLRVGALSGAYLANIGEFSFLLISLASAQSLIGEALYHGLLISSALTMMFTPVLVGLTQGIGQFLFPHRWMPLQGDRLPSQGLQDHVIIIGYGLNGRNLARILHEVGVPYGVIDFNGAIVREAAREGEPILYGDATHPEVLEAAGIQKARAVIFAMSDPINTRYAVATARRLNPSVYLLARTRYVSEIEPLYRAGASEVVPEEFEAFLTIVDRLLGRFLISQEMRDAIKQIYHEEHYGVLRDRCPPREVEELLPEMSKQLTTKTFWVSADSPWVGRTLGELGMRERLGVTVLAVIRGEGIVSHPAPDWIIQANDGLVLIGPRDRMDGVINQLQLIEVG